VWAAVQAETTSVLFQHKMAAQVAVVVAKTTIIPAEQVYIRAQLI
jgi:hypothetical protein